MTRGELTGLPDARSCLAARVRFVATVCPSQRIARESRFYGVRDGRHSPVVCARRSLRWWPPALVTTFHWTCWYCTCSEEIRPLEE